MRSILRRIILLHLVATVGWSANPVAPAGEAPNAQAGAHGRACVCDPARPETMEARECSLCREAEKQPVQAPLFFLKDNNPRKPNRWLALPRTHTSGMHRLADLSPAQRTEFWKATMEKARSLWGDQWGLAINGDGVRTQCHAHVHIGKLLERTANDDLLLNAEGSPSPGSRPKIVKGPAKIPPPRKGEALWIHPHGKKLHVHIEDRSLATEFVLLR